MEDRAAAQKAHFAGVFSRAASTYDQVGPRFFTHFGRLLVEIAGIKPGMHVLDVACGKGAVLFPAADCAGGRGRVTGVDLSTGMIRAVAAEVARRAVPGITSHQMDAERLALRAELFDAVLCGLSIFFLPDPVAGLAEFRRVVKPGGTIAVTTFAFFGGDAYRWQEAIWRRYLPPPHPNAPKGPTFHTAEGMQTLFAEAGVADSRVAQHDLDVVLADAEEWWALQWSVSRRGILERIPPGDLDAVKAEFFTGLRQHIEPDGIHIPISVLFTLGTT